MFTFLYIISIIINNIGDIKNINFINNNFDNLRFKVFNAKIEDIKSYMVGNSDLTNFKRYEAKLVNINSNEEINCRCEIKRYNNNINTINICVGNIVTVLYLNKKEIKKFLSFDSEFYYDYYII